MTGARNPRVHRVVGHRLALVVIFALFPVLWIVSLSLKTPATVGDGRVIPKEWTFDNYSAIFDRRLRQPDAAAADQLDPASR